MNKAVHALAAVTLGALALVSCAAQNPNDAAIVGNTQVRQADVDQTVAELLAATQAQPGQLRLAVVNTLINGQVAQQLASTNNVPLTDEARAEIVKQVPELVQLSQTEGGRRYVDNATDYVIVARKLGQDKYLTECSRMQISVNPRYGSWVPDACQLSGASGSLSRVAPTMPNP